MIPAGLKKWLAVGSGVGIQIVGPNAPYRKSESLRVTAVRVRPSGARLLAGLTIEDFAHQPAGVWGADYTAFLGKLNLKHAIAVVALPRQDLTVRALSLAGVSDRDLDSAVRFQLDGLHPYNEDDVYSSWARLPGTSTVLVAVARREPVDRYAASFAEAGIKIAGFTCSAAAVYSALRLFGAKPSSPMLGWDATPNAPDASISADASDSAREEDTPVALGYHGVEFYGESAARPIFSASFDLEPARAAALAIAELRADPSLTARPLSEVLGADPPIPYATALMSACPRLALALNLLPAAQRQTRSALRWAPSSALAVLVLLTAGGLAAYPGYASRRYLRSLEAQIATLTPRAARAAQIDRQTADAQARIQLLDDLRRRPKADMDVLQNLTHILTPPTWLNLAQISDRQVVVGGETPQAAPLLKTLDSSPLFEGSEFMAPPTRIQGGEAFRIRTNRKNVPVPLVAASSQAGKQGRRP
jgi:hypothetical protein